MQDIVEERPGQHAARGQQSQRLQHVLPDNDGEGNRRISGQVVINLGLLIQDIEDMGPADKFVAIDIGISPQLLDPGIGLLSHDFFPADGQRPRRAGLDAGGRFVTPQAIVAEVAFVNLIRLPVVAGDIEGTGGNAFLAAYTAGGIQSHRSELRVVEGAAGADLHTGRIGAVHAAVLPEEPFKGPLVTDIFLEADQRPGVPL